jgi:V/A-type H+-transporting ATPase subunit E
MQGIENITSRIQADAQAEADKVLADAKNQAGEIAARYEAQAQKEAQDILARGEKNAAERTERLASVAQMEAKKLTLAAKQEMLDKAFDLALDRLVSLPDQEYVDLLASLAAKASTSGREQLIFSQKDRTRVGKQVVAAANDKLAGKGALTLSEQTRPMRGGFILSDGDVEVNCAFETLVRLQRGEISGEVAKALFD